MSIISVRSLTPFKIFSFSFLMKNEYKFDSKKYFLLFYLMFTHFKWFHLIFKQNSNNPGILRTHEPNSTTFRWRMILFDRTFNKISCIKFQSSLEYNSLMCRKRKKYTAKTQCNNLHIFYYTLRGIYTIVTFIGWTIFVEPMCV